MTVVVAECSQAPDWELRSKNMGPIPSNASNFSIPDCNKINKADLVWVIEICSHRHLWRDPYKSVDYWPTSDDSLLHKVIILNKRSEWKSIEISLK